MTIVPLLKSTLLIPYTETLTLTTVLPLVLTITSTSFSFLFVQLIESALKMDFGHCLSETKI